LHNMSRMFCNRRDTAQMLARFTCLLVTPVALSLGAPVYLAPVFFFLGFGLRNEISKPIELLGAIPAAAKTALSRCWGNPEDDDDDVEIKTDYGSWGGGIPWSSTGDVVVSDSDTELSDDVVKTEESSNPELIESESADPIVSEELIRSDELSRDKPPASD